MHVPQVAVGQKMEKPKSQRKKWCPRYSETTRKIAGTGGQTDPVENFGRPESKQKKVLEKKIEKIFVYIR